METFLKLVHLWFKKNVNNYSIKHSFIYFSAYYPKAIWGLLKLNQIISASISHHYPEIELNYLWFNLLMESTPHSVIHSAVGLGKATKCTMDLFYEVILSTVNYNVLIYWSEVLLLKFDFLSIKKTWVNLYSYLLWLMVIKTKGEL